MKYKLQTTRKLYGNLVSLPLYVKLVHKNL
jgi:hypothetical protein